jgi:hypothetical protein
MVKARNPKPEFRRKEENPKSEIDASRLAVAPKGHLSGDVTCA